MFDFSVLDGMLTYGSRERGKVGGLMLTFFKKFATLYATFNG